MGSLMTSESQDTRLTSHPKDSTLHRQRPQSLPWGIGIFFLDPRKECLLLALQHHFQQHLVSHPGTNQDQPCLASEARQQWDAGWYAAGMLPLILSLSLSPTPPVGPEPSDNASGLPGLMTPGCPQSTWSCCCYSFNCSACGYGTLTLCYLGFEKPTDIYS